MYSSLALEHQLAKESLKKSYKALAERILVKEFIHYGISRACRILNLSKSV